MSKHLDALKKGVEGGTLRATAEGMGLAVGLTDEEFVTARAKLFGAKVERFPLRALSAIHTIPNPAANVLGLDFATTPPSSVSVMYGAESQNAFAAILEALRKYLPAGGGAR